MTAPLERRSIYCTSRRRADTHARVERRILVTRLHPNATDENDVPVYPPLTSRFHSESFDGRPAWLKSERRQLASENTQIRWRKKLGQFVTKDVIVPKWESQGKTWPKAGITQGRLESFPDGYVLYSVKRVKDSGRCDHYLWCEKRKVEYRSPEEFAPHLAWIMQGRVRDADGKPTCRCWDCNQSGPSQDDILKGYKDVHKYFSQTQTGSSTSKGRASQLTTNMSQHRHRNFILSTRASNRSNLPSSLDQAFRAKNYSKF